MTLTAWIYYCRGDMDASRHHPGVNRWCGKAECKNCNPWCCKEFADGFGIICPAVPRSNDWYKYFIPDPIRNSSEWKEWVQSVPGMYKQLTLFDV